MSSRQESPGVFTWGSVFQRGDLPIFITNQGLPSTPYSITYTIYWYPSGSNCPIQAGPAGQTPVTADVGEFYVSGVAGQCGQPGDWVVVWRYQETSLSQVSEARFGFKVFNSAAYCGTGSTCGCGSSCGGCGCQSPYPACRWACNGPCTCATTTETW